ncbi:MAG: 3-methyl-2-oxobutanoate hydroxymethyltransferase, partial [Balneolales bacterium]
GGSSVADTVKRIVNAGIPVMGHLGLTPQSIYKFGTYKVRATDEIEANELIEDAKKLEEAGCFAIVLEKIPAKLAKQVTESISIPTIGIGAGGHCDGQVLVLHDMLGLNKDFNPRFIRRYADLHSTITEAVQNYGKDVKESDFPGENEQYDS